MASAVPPGLNAVAGGIHYREALSPLARAFVLVMALAMFVLPVPFVLHARWSEPSFTTLVAALFGLAPAALGLVFLRMGLTPAKQIFFDRAQRVLRVRWQGPLTGWWQRGATIAFDAVTDVAVERCKGLEEPDSFVLRVQVACRRQPYRLGMLAREDEALLWQGRLRELLHSHRGSTISA